VGGVRLCNRLFPLEALDVRGFEGGGLEQTHRRRPRRADIARERDGLFGPLHLEPLGFPPRNALRPLQRLGLLVLFLLLGDRGEKGRAGGALDTRRGIIVVALAAVIIVVTLPAVIAAVAAALLGVLLVLVPV